MVNFKLNNYPTSIYIHFVIHLTNFKILSQVFLNFLLIFLMFQLSNIIIIIIKIIKFIKITSFAQSNFMSESLKSKSGLMPLKCSLDKIF